MNDAQDTREQDCRRPRRARRQAAAVVAQYIHELWDRRGETENAGVVAAAGRTA
jgi:hypothetical protein